MKLLSQPLGPLQQAEKIKCIYLHSDLTTIRFIYIEINRVINRL